MSNGWEISKDTWDHMQPAQREWILFETVQKVCQRVECLETRERKASPWPNRALSFAGGVVGGVLAIFGREVVGK
ncbi:MAG: hypothetical protein PHY29_03045 [Syntrophales bacterium]|nr:hypothetical protein [Syntrophales bacterium]